MTTRLIIVGGFLGAGKTTLLLNAAQRLISQGYRVGLVTNDQGEGLVDTATVSQHDIPVTEVAGGCFCCRFPDLIKALRRLQKTVAPDIILAEPVGSCTDLVATILLPLQHYYPELFEVAPLTILLDGDRNTAEFPAIVNYLYQKQLAEADLIGLNKCDLLTPAQQKQKLAELEASYPHSRVLKLSARSGEGLDDWLALALAETSQARQPLSLDYAKYAEAEAGLGWLNAKGALIARPSFEAQSWATRLLTNMEENFAAQAAPIGHIKISLKTPAGTLKASLTQLGRPIDWDAAPARVETDRAQFILNARVNTDPQTLAQTVRRSFEATRPQPDFRCDFTHFECFSPSPPQPTYRESGD